MMTFILHRTKIVSPKFVITPPPIICNQFNYYTMEHLDLETRFKEMHLLGRNERVSLIKELNLRKPDFLKPFTPKYWWWRKCKTKVLIVADGGLNFGMGGFDLSEFLTTFNELEVLTGSNYEVTLAHRSGIINSPNPVVVNHISSFNFATSVDLNDFDQVWLFAISSGGSIAVNEINAIEDYMDNGGGLFATGDHGSLGRTMCGNIPRVQDMRFWNNTPVGSTNDTNEVSMSGRRRNDTNQPRPGSSTANTFDHQSDDIPQTIAVRTFQNGMPHPLLSIKKALRPSGIIDIMPDHPHEGEAAPETSFTVNGVNVPTQIIATSFVVGGNTSGGKDGTDPHCFPSIAVWDGRQAKVGRIVIDSTWHHFVNINLNGAGSSQGGLTAADFEVVRNYYMNIAKWMTRRKFILCWRRFVLVDLLKNSQIVEASLDNPNENLKDISLADLNSIGKLAEEELASKFNPGFGRHFLLDMVEDLNKELVETLNVWNPQSKEEKKASYYRSWVDIDLILHTAIGAGFIALHADKRLSQEDFSEKALDVVEKVFSEGFEFGYKSSLEDLKSSYNNIMKGL